MSLGDRCLKCEGDSKVIDSRTNKAGVRRRRECLNCGHRWSTQEVPVDYYRIVQMKPNPKHLPTLAEELIRQHLELEYAFNQVQTDADFSDLPADLRGEYANAEAEFLAAASETKQHHFQISYNGQPFNILCDKEYEEVDINLVILLGVA